MKNISIFKLVIILSSFFFSSQSFAQSFAVVNKDAKIFDEPNVKGYVTLNTQNQEVTPQSGMVFKILENNKGWYLVEYSPGLKGYLSQQYTCSPESVPNAGIYPVTNQPGSKIAISFKNGIWSAEASGKTFQGKAFDNIVVFFNSDNQPAYSLVNLEGKVIAMSYDNSITKFF